MRNKFSKDDREIWCGQETDVPMKMKNKLSKDDRNIWHGQEADVPMKIKNKVGLGRIGNPLPELHFLGNFDKICDFCGAIKFEKEDEFNCCLKGKVSLLQMEPFPSQLRDLFVGNSNQAKQFRFKIRVCNNAFAFASFGANIAPPPGVGPPTFRICGQIFHRDMVLFFQDKASLSLLSCT